MVGTAPERRLQPNPRRSAIPANSFPDAASTEAAAKAMGVATQKTRQHWRLSFVVDKFVTTEIVTNADENPEYIEGRHLAAQVVEVQFALEELVAHLQMIGIAQDDVRLMTVSTKAGQPFQVR